MFRTTLLATTALVLGVSVAVARPAIPTPKLPAGSIAVTTVKGHPEHPRTVMLTGGQKSGQQQPGHINLEPIKDPTVVFNNLSKNANAKFLSFYGYYAEAYSFSASYYKESYYIHDAMPITGDGNAHKTIIVPIFQYSGAGNSYTVGIYSNTSSNLPGAAVATGTAHPSAVGSLCCTQLQTVHVPKTVLGAGTKYWVEVNASATAGCQCETAGLWLMEDTNFTTHSTGDVFQYHDYFEESGFTYSNVTSGWMASSFGPPAGPAFEVK